MLLLWYPGLLLKCCYAVAMVPGVVARLLLGYPGKLLGVASWLLRYPGWLLGCCYAVAMVFRVVAKVLLGYSG